MDEERWLSYDNPRDMLSFLDTRRLRLFGCACARRIWHLMRDVRCRQAVEVSERFADGLAKRKELHKAHLNVSFLLHTMYNLDHEDPDFRSVSVAVDVTRKDSDLRWAVSNFAIKICSAVAASPTPESHHRTEQQIQVAIIRDLADGLFHSVNVAPTLLTWNSGLVLRLAQTAYNERILPARTFETSRLAILADALEEAGCSDEQILGHLRNGGDHYRGCFVLDALLGKS